MYTNNQNIRKILDIVCLPHSILQVYFTPKIKLQAVINYIENTIHIPEWRKKTLSFKIWKYFIKKRLNERN